MARRKALLFTDVARFLDYVRIGSPESESSRGFELLEVTWPASGQRALVLLGHRARSFSLLQHISRVFRSAPAEPFTHIDIITDEDALIWLDEGRQRPCVVHSRRGAHRLIELVSLLPWHDAPDGGPVLCRSGDVAALERLALDSLSLDNDRIQVAGLSQGELLLKVEAPSWYLLQRCLEEDSGITLYAPMPGAGGQAWVQWGWRHPLARLWGATLDPGAFVLFTAGRARQELVSPDWQDLYDTAQVILDVPAEPIILSAVEVTERFTITVHLAPRARPAEPELWLVEEGDRAELERLLSALDDADLEDLLVAPVAAPGRPTRFLIRERHTGTGRKFIDFSPRAFSPWIGVPDLFIPSDQTLLPHLRRDRYRALFSLRPGWVSVLIDVGELIQVSASAFAPLSRLVDYQISTEAQRIESLLNRNLFEFAPYTGAPSRPDLMERRRTERTTSQPSATADEPASQDAPRASTPAASEAEEKPETSRPELLAPSEDLTDIERRARDLEREIIDEPTATRWAELAITKEKQGLTTAAFRSSVEAWWLSPGKSDDDWHARALQHIVAALSLTGGPAAQARQALQKGGQPAAIAYVLLGRQLPPGQIDSWVLQSARLLSGLQDDLPKKLRWLAWGEVWKVNLDIRAQARVRSQILAELDAAGLAPIDVPDFLQERLLKERGLTDEQDAGEVVRALTNLEGIHNAIRGMPTELRCGGMAVLARAYQRLGRLDRASLCLEQARQEKTSALVTAWIRLLSEPTPKRGSSAKVTALLADLPAFEASELRGFADSLQARQDEDSPLSFLSTENLSRLYPSTPSLKRNPLHARIEQIALARKKNQHQQVVTQLRQWLTDAEKQAGSASSRDIATLVHMAVRELSRLQSSSVGKELIQQFDAFSRQCLKQIGSRDDYFAMLFQLSLAQGSIDLKKPGPGLKTLGQTMALLHDADCITLDLVDICAAAIQVLESADLTQRGGALDGLLRALVAQTRRLPDLASSSSTLSVLRLLDQLCEASVSKDRFTLSRYRRYQDLDELQIRERILSEDHCL